MSSLLPSSSSYSKLENDDLEKTSLQVKQKIKTPKKSNYGSLRNQDSPQTANAFILNYKHKIQLGETLQGLSLKYGVPIESIKRANRLWSNDLALLKDTIIVPINRDKLAELNIDFNDSILSSQSDASFNQSLNNSNLEKSESQLNSSNKNKEEYKDFLSKFDSFINESKIKLKSLESNSNLTNNDHLKSKNNISNNFSRDSNNNNDENDFSVKAKHQKNKINNSTNNFEDEILISNQNEISNNNENKSYSNNFNSITDETPEMLITAPNKYTNYYSSNHNLIASSTASSASNRAKLAQENLQRLEREKDDLYEL